MKEKAYWHDGLVAFFRMSGWIVGPVLPALFLGKWLDSKFGMTPYLLVLSMSIGFFVSCLGILREAKSYNKKVNKSEIKNDE